MSTTTRHEMPESARAVDELERMGALMNLSDLAAELDRLITDPSELRLEALFLELLDEGLCSVEELEDYVEHSDEYFDQPDAYLAEAGFLSSLKRAAKKVFKKVKKAVKGAGKKVASAFGMKAKKGAGCKPGEKMVFGTCRKVSAGTGKRDLDADADLDTSKSGSWYRKQAAKHKAKAKEHSDSLSNSWREDDLSVPKNHLLKSMSHHQAAKDHEALAKMKPAERAKYAAQRKAERAAEAAKAKDDDAESSKKTASGVRRKSGASTATMVGGPRKGAGATAVGRPVRSDAQQTAAGRKRPAA